MARKAFGDTPKEKESLKIFWKGLKSDIKGLTVSACPLNFDEAVKIAKSTEKYLSDKESKEIQCNSLTEPSTSYEKLIERRSRPYKKERSYSPSNSSRSSSRDFSRYDRPRNDSTNRYSQKSSIQTEILIQNKHNLIKTAITLESLVI